MNFRHWLGRLLLIFLAYLILFPVWLRIQPFYCGTLVGATQIWLKVSEFPRLTEKLEFDGNAVRIFGVRQKESYGEWEDIQFPFYLPFLLLLIFLVPGPPRRERGYLGAGVLLLVAALHLVLITVVVKQTHIHFYELKGISIAGPAVAFLLDWLKRLLFDFGKQAVSGGLILYLILRYRVALRDHGTQPDGPPEASSRPRWKWQTAAALLGSILAAAALAWGLQRPFKRSRPWYEEFQLDRGKASLQEGRIPEATEAFREALRVNPSRAANHYHLGVALGRGNRWQEAGDSFRQSLSLDPDDPLTNRDFGLTLIRLGMKCQALPHLRKAAGIADLPGGAVPEPLIGKLASECERGNLGPPPSEDRPPVRLSSRFSRKTPEPLTPATPCGKRCRVLTSA